MTPHFEAIMACYFNVYPLKSGRRFPTPSAPVWQGRFLHRNNRRTPNTRSSRFPFFSAGGSTTKQTPQGRREQRLLQYQQASYHHLNE